MEKRKTEQKKPRINLRPLLFCALGLAFGLFVYFRIRFGGFSLSDLCFAAIFLVLAAIPFGRGRFLCLALAVVLFAGMGAGLAHLSAERYQAGLPGGKHTITGTVRSVIVYHGYSNLLLKDVYFDGEKTGGKLTVVISSDEIRAGDMLRFSSNVQRYDLPHGTDSYARYLFYADIRYNVSSVDDFERTGISKDLFLRLNALLYDRLNEGMDEHEAEVAYALLTGDSRGMDEGLMEEVRSGGIAHIFAVSGLHIGILFGAALLIFKRLGRKSFFPAIAVALLYTAFCGFTVSSVRALVMCAVLGGCRAVGRKYDMLESISLAAILVLLLLPRSWLSPGFRLSFGACLGLALFSGSLGRLFKKIRLPAFLAGYLAANLSVQLFTAPILLDTFGFFSVWGLLLNLIFVPLLPVFFLTVLLFSLLAVTIPPAAVLLCVPASLIDLMFLLFAHGDFGLVLTGFSLGMGATVWVIGCLLMTERTRMKGVLRAAVFGSLAAVFALALVLENVVFSGMRGEVFACRTGSAALFRTHESAVLVIDGDISLDELKGITARRVSKLDAVLVLSDDEIDGIDRAIFLPAETVYACDERVTGLKEREVVFAKEIAVGEMKFTYAARDKLLIAYGGTSVEVDFEGEAALGADLFLDGASELRFTAGNGMIKL